MQLKVNGVKTKYRQVKQKVILNIKQMVYVRVVVQTDIFHTENEKGEGWETKRNMCVTKQNPSRKCIQNA